MRISPLISESWEETESLLARLWTLLVPTVRYLFTIESHVYAMAIAASVLFGFFPFTVLLLSLTRNILGWRGAAEAVFIGLNDMLPNDPGVISFLERNLNAAVQMPGRAEVLSVLALIFSVHGVFMPLEVALNRLWRFTSDRSYYRNQAISLGLAVVCGILTLSAAVITSANLNYLETWMDRWVEIPESLELLVLKIASIPFSIIIVLLIYWIVPNGKVPIKCVLPVSVAVGLTLEVVKNIYLWVWPVLEFRHAYGPFFISVTLLFWGFLAAMILLGGGELSARLARRDQES